MDFSFAIYCPISRCGEKTLKIFMATQWKRKKTSFQFTEMYLAHCGDDESKYCVAPQMADSLSLDLSFIKGSFSVIRFFHCLE